MGHTYKKFKTINELQRGDIIRHITYAGALPQTWVVEAVYGTYAIAVTTMNIANPPEWEVLVPTCRCCGK